MLLPNPERAVVDIVKLRDYCLSPAHPVGKHKAKVFQSALGLTSADALFLQQTLLNAASVQEVTPGDLDLFGQRYTLDLDVVFHSRSARVRSSWIVLVAEDFPRLVTCYVL